MGQYREYIETISITDDTITIKTTYNGYQFTDVIDRDGSMDTNFKAALAAHRDAILDLRPSATSTPCSVMTTGRWFKNQAAASITSAATSVIVPTGNSGDLILHRDTGAFTMQYSIAGGTLTTFTDGASVTVTDGQSLAFKATGIPEQDAAIGSVEDSDTGSTLDSIQLYNTTPAP